MRRKKQVRTVRGIVEIFDAKIGRGEFARFIYCGKQYVYRYKQQGYLPENTYLRVSAKLAQWGYEAPPSLWRMLPTAKAA